MDSLARRIAILVADSRETLAPIVSASQLEQIADSVASRSPVQNTSVLSKAIAAEIRRAINLKINDAVLAVSIDLAHSRLKRRAP